MNPNFFMRGRQITNYALLKKNPRSGTELEQNFCVVTIHSFDAHIKGIVEKRIIRHHDAAAILNILKFSVYYILLPQNQMLVQNFRLIGEVNFIHHFGRSPY